MGRYLFIALTVYLIYRLFIKQIMMINSQTKINFFKIKKKNIDKMVQDPYCELYLPIQEALFERINGSKLFFCSKQCRDAYLVSRNFSKIKKNRDNSDDH